MATTDYVAPQQDFTERNLNQGLLEYNSTASKDLTFDGRDINASAIGANVSDTTPDFATSDNYLTNGAFVENRVKGLLEDPDNPLMQRAKAQGIAEAGSRGLHNTTMAGTIGETAMIDKALQIASPDAATQATADTNRQTATYQSQQAQQDAKNQGSLAEQAARINSELETQRQGYEWGARTQQAAIQGDLNTQQANIEGAKTTQQAGYAQDAREQQGLIEGAQASQQANIDTAARTQQAGIDTQARTQQAGIDTAARTQQAGIDTTARNQEANLASQARTQQAGIDTAARTQQAGIDTAARTQQASIDKAMEMLQSANIKSLEELKQKGNEILQTMQNDFAERVAEIGYDRQDTQLLAGMINSQTQTMMNQLGNLFANEDIEMNDNVTKWFTDFMDASWKSGAELFNIDIDLR